MSAWSSRRQLTYLLIVLIVLGFVGVWAYVSFFVEAPTCFDGELNQNEIEVDCGGECQKVCISETVPLKINWARSMRVSNDRFNAVAFVENPNIFGREEIGYRFRLEEADGGFIAEREGTTYMNSGELFMIFEANIPVGTREPRRTSFEFTDGSEWYRKTEEEKKIPVPEFSVKDKKMDVEDNFQKATAILRNTSVVTARDVEVVAVIFDSDKNAIAASKTFVEELPSESDQRITFSWPIILAEEASFFEVYPRVNIVKLTE